MTLFCDDLRQEMQGTITLVGMYGGEMFINGEFPFVVPKLSLLVRLFEDPAQAFSSDGSIKVFVPQSDEPVFEMSVPYSQRPNPTSVFPSNEDFTGLDKILMMQMPIIFSPIIINGEGSIKVRLYVGDAEYRIGAIRIKKGISPVVSNVSQQPSSQSPPAAPAS